MFEVDHANFLTDRPIPAEMVTHSFTDTDQLTGTSSSLAISISNIHYDLFGRQSKVFYGNGVVDQKDYSDRTGNFRLETIKTWKGTVCSPSTQSTCYQDLSYATRDGAGDLLTFK